MPRENSKCRKWEKERRDRLSEAFTLLAKQLPSYDPSINICKIDILQKATSSIQELQDKVKQLLSSDIERKTGTDDIIKKLQDRVKKLLVRNEQLSNLLRDAKISMPSECGAVKKFKKTPAWSKRISPEQAEAIQKDEMEKENICSKLNRGKKKRTKTVNTGTAQKPHRISGNGVKRKGLDSRKKKNHKKIKSSNCLIVLSQPTTVQGDFNHRYFVISNQPSTNVHKTPINTGTNNTEVLSKPLTVTHKSKTAKDLFQINPSLSSLGLGTLILANGTIVPILPQSQMVLPTLSNLLVNSTVCVFPKNPKTQENERNENILNCNPFVNGQFSNAGALPAIKPKRCLTRTTQVNKVPIPALTSPYANNYYLLNATGKEYFKAKEILSTKKPNKAEQMKDSNQTNRRRADKRKSNFETSAENELKKNKNDETISSITKNNENNSDRVSNTSVDVNNPPTSGASQGDKTDIEIINKENLQNAKSNILTDSSVNKKGDEVESFSNKTVPLENNRTEKISGSDIFDEQQNNNDNPNPQETLIIATTATATTVTTTTTTTTHNVLKNLDLNLGHSELSNDIFASLQVPSGCQNPESTSPTAAFLLAFPLVSSGVKVTEVIDEENSVSQRGTPTLLQIGTMDSTKTTQSQTEAITSNLMSLDSFSFFPSKDSCGNFYNYSSATSKGNKITVSNTTLTVSTNPDAVVNRSVYVDVKSPCLPNCAAEPIKENYNTYDLKIVNTSKEIPRNTESCAKKNSIEKVSSSVNFSAHNQINNQSISKTNANYPIYSKDNQAHKTSDQKSQYYIPPSYSNSTCNFNYRRDTTKICNTCSYVNINRNYTNPLYTNCSNYGYNYHPDTNFNQNYYKNIHRNDTKTYYPLNYDNYPDYRKNENALIGGYYETPYAKEKKNNSAVKIKTTSQNKLPINWMTTPDNRLQNSECLLNSFSKGDFSQTYPFSSYVTSSSSCFTTTPTDANNTSCIMEAKKSLDLPHTVSLNSHQRLDTEEKQFSWSPTKLPHFLDHPHNFVTSTLPTLVGDLALGNPLAFGEQKNDYKYFKENKEVRHNNRISNYENQNNFLSVSQLVEHNKPECIPAKTSTRRNSGSRSKNTFPQKTKRSSKQEKDISNCGINNDKICQRLPSSCNILSNNEVFSEQKSRNATKNTTSNYSAEALIGNQVPDETVNRKYPPSTSKSLGMPGFLTENIISYFPSTDIPQENYMSQNQSYPTNNFAHNLCTCQNSAYSANNFIYTTPTITSTYLTTTNFDSGSHDYLQENLVSNITTKDKHYNTKNFNNRQLNKEDKSSHNSICANNLKKPKKKPTSDSSSTLSTLEFPFLSMPGSNNSPILPDDFHSHANFLPPPNTPFCKNSLYPKQNNELSTSSIIPLHPISRTNTQHPEISPSVGTSLTNFNLSTIFPEINKGSMTEIFPDPRVKQHPHSKTSTSASPQVPFNTEPKFSFST